MFFRKKAHMTAIIFFGFFVKNHFFYLSGVPEPPGGLFWGTPLKRGSRVDLRALELFLGFIDRIYASIVPLYL